MKRLIKKFEGGNPNGKSVLIIGGVHGDELTPIYTLAVMCRNSNEHEKFNLGALESLTVVNGFNTSGIKNASREMVINNTQDLNRILSTDVDDSYVELLKGLIDSHDVVIDIHSSPSCCEFALIDIDEYTLSMENWCNNASVRTAFRYSGGNTIKRYCLEKGKPAVTLEFNKMNVIDFESVSKCIKVINGLLSTVDSVKINKNEPDVKPLSEVKTYKSGIFSPMIQNGDFVRPNTLLGIVKDFELNDILYIKSDFEGVIISSPNNHFVNRGDTIFLIQQYI